MEKYKNGRNIVTSRIARKKYYHNHKESEKKRTSDRAKELRKWFNELKLTLSCQKCRYKGAPTAIEFHHRNPNEKELEIALAISNGWSKERILSEIEKCDILCSNCHRELEYNNRGIG